VTTTQITVLEATQKPPTRNKCEIGAGFQSPQFHLFWSILPAKPLLGLLAPLLPFFSIPQEVVQILINRYTKSIDTQNTPQSLIFLLREIIKETQLALVP
jgi:hypothetical protein